MPSQRKAVAAPQVGTSHDNRWVLIKMMDHNVSSSRKEPFLLESLHVFLLILPVALEVKTRCFKREKNLSLVSSLAGRGIFQWRAQWLNSVHAERDAWSARWIPERLPCCWWPSGVVGMRPINKFEKKQRLLYRQNIFFIFLLSLAANIRESFDIFNQFALTINLRELVVLQSSSLTYLGLSCSIRLIKSPFSMQSSHVSSQSLRIFFRSRTFNFLRSTVFTSMLFSVTM